MILAIKPQIVAREVKDIGQVYFRQWSQAEFNRLRARLMDKAGKAKQDEMVTRFVIAGVCESDGSPVFTDADYQQVNEKPSAILMRLFRAIQDVNALTDDDTDEIVGNSAGTTQSDSGIA